MNTYHFFVSVETDSKISSRGLKSLEEVLHEHVLIALSLVGQRYTVKKVFAVTTTRLEERGERQWRNEEEI